MSKPPLAIVGAGRVGSALAILLKRKGYRVAGVASRSMESAVRVASEVGTAASTVPWEVTPLADVVFITTPDREIAKVAEQIAAGGGFRPGQVVFHTSGAHSAEEIGAARRFGAAVASLHPLQSFADLQAAVENLPGSYFALEGDKGALILAEQIVRDLEGKSFYINAADKPLYHAAACIACNYLVSLLHLSYALYSRFGLGRREAEEALRPLVEGTLKNIRRAGPAGALTGPISRGDGPTVEDHLRALREVGERETEVYKALAAYTVGIALEKGTLSSAKAGELMEIIKRG